MEKPENEKQRRTSRDKRKNSLSEEASETQISVKLDGEAKKGKLPHWKVCGFLIAVDCWLQISLLPSVFHHSSGSTSSFYVSLITDIPVLFFLPIPLAPLTSSSSFPQLPPATAWCVAPSVNRSLVCPSPSMTPSAQPGNLHHLMGKLQTSSMWPTWWVFSSKSVERPSLNVFTKKISSYSCFLVELGP